MQNKFLGLMPPMGWNSWNTFTHAINEDLIKETADAMASSGLKDAGYEYVVIDDCWSLRQRDQDGFLVPDPEKFPHGMKAVADYVHEKGLKFGMYSCDGTHTCAGYPGSFEHEFQDAATFAAWGVDYLKYDNCYKPRHMDGEMLYKRMSLALRNCGRDILFSACNWGSDDVWSWIQGSGAQLFRSTGDIQDSWESIKNLALSQMDKMAYSGPFCHNDIDMLVVGMHGGSNNEFIGSVKGGCTDEEYRTHFSLWAMMNSPLMIGCDIRKMSEYTKETLCNPDLIAINQDIECRGPYVVPGHDPAALMALVKPMSDGSLAIGLFNLGDRKAEMSLQFWDMGIPAAAGVGLEMYDCWVHQTEGTFTERYAAQIEPHGCRVFRAKLVKVR
ncbi:glycoside hydrolase family 27 protein [Oscillospiraceae bacterium 42-9]